MYLPSLNLNICECDLLDNSIFIWDYYICYSIVSELHMVKHKYLILGYEILFKTKTVLFSVYNSILLSTQETSCGNIWNSPIS